MSINRTSKKSSTQASSSLSQDSGLTSAQKDKINKLESISGLSRDEARQLLEALDYNLEAALEVQFGQTTLSSTGEKVVKPLVNDDAVRAPIPQKSEKLVDYNPYALTRPQKRPRTVFDGFRDLKSESEEMENPQLAKKRQTLAQLFRPPLDLIFNGTFEIAKKIGTKQSKWILIDIQNTEEFECQILNRDLWSDETIKEIVKANFVFIQTYFDSEEGNRLVTSYKIAQYPFVAIIDPRTGEKMKSWCKLDSHVFCELVTNFLADNELPLADDNEDDPNERESFANKIKQLQTSNGVDTDKAKKFTSECVTSELLNKIKVDEESSCASSNDDESVVEKKPVELPQVTVGPPKHIKYETKTKDKLDCTLRIMCPNGDRIDFLTNGECLFKFLVEYLHSLGYRSTKYELIERLLPNEQRQSRNLLNANLKQTFKHLNLYPRVFLLLQEL